MRMELFLVLAGLFSLLLAYRHRRLQKDADR